LAVTVPQTSTWDEDAQPASASSAAKNSDLSHRICIDVSQRRLRLASHNVCFGE
jgi:hypothetical protein